MQEGTFVGMDGFCAHQDYDDTATGPGMYIAT